MAKILIVDDDSHFTDVCRLILEREGFEVRTASNRREGLTLVEEDTPDLMILDVMMEYPDDEDDLPSRMNRAIMRKGE